MRNYFHSDLRAGKVVPYVLASLAIALICGIAAGLLSVNPQLLDYAELSVGLILNQLLGLALLIIGTLASIILMLPVMKNIIATTRYKDEYFEPDFDTRAYLWIVVKGILLSFITLGIYTPWFYTRLLKFWADGTTHRYNHISFNSRGSIYFCYTVLGFLLPYVVVMMLTVGFATAAENSSMRILYGVLMAVVSLLAIALFCSLMMRWFINLTYGRSRVVMEGGAFGLFMPVLKQIIFTVLTLGIYAPMATMRITQAALRRTVVGEELIEGRMGLSLRPWADWAYIWGQLLIVVVTLSIYTPWAITRITRRFMKRTYVEEIEKPNRPMPTMG